jgi:hypothetical protein
MQVGGWACEASCFANNPGPDLQEGLGTLEIKLHWCQIRLPIDSLKAER